MDEEDLPLSEKGMQVKTPRTDLENTYLLEEDNQPPDKTRIAEPKTCSETFYAKRPYIVEIPAFIYFLAYRACLPLKEQLVFVYMAAYYLPQNEYILQPNETASTCDQNNNGSLGDEQYLDQLIQADSSRWLSFFNLARNFPALLSALLICSFTDVCGRKLGLLLPAISGALKAILFIAFIYFKLPIQYFLICEFIEGVGGSLVTAQSVANLYLADILSNEQLAFRFMFIQGLQFVATALGNLAIGYLISFIGYICCFWVIAGFYSINVLYLIIVLPESLQRNNKTDFNAVKTLRHAVGVFRIYCRKGRDEFVNTKLMLMLLVVVLDNIVLLGRNDVDVLYMLGSPFCWSSVTIGYFQAAKYLLKGAGGTIVVKGLQFFLSSCSMGLLGALSGTSGNVLMGLAPTSIALWFVAPVSMLSGMMAPLAQAIMSSLLHQDEQAALFASLGVMEGVCDLISGALLNLLFSATVFVLVGMVFVLIGVFFLIAGACFVTCMWLDKKKEMKEDP